MMSPERREAPCEHRVMNAIHAGITLWLNSVTPAFLTLEFFPRVGVPFVRKILQDPDRIKSRKAPQGIAVYM